MATTAFFSLPFYSHVNISLYLVSELVRRGERVYFYSADEFRPQIEQTGAIFCSYGNVDDRIGIYDNPLLLTYDIAKLTPELVEACLPTVRSQQPDYIIYDTFAYWGGIIAQVLGLPTIASQATFSLRSQVVAKYPSLREKLLTYLSEVGKEIAESNRIFAHIADTFQIAPIKFPDTMTIWGEHTFVYTSRQFQPASEVFDPQYVHFIGPYIKSRHEASDFPFERLAQDKPLIYISLGTIFNNDPAFFRACLQAFAGTAYQVVMSIGNKVDAAALGSIPDNFIIGTHVPQIQLLSRCALFITHGGLNSVVEAMYKGVPMVVIPPAGGDQPFIALRIQELGAGQILDPQSISAQSLREAAEFVLAHSSFAEASATIGASLQDAGGSTYAGNIIEQFKREKGIDVSVDVQ
jgi:MGT family glycosyltransferase